ncbi:MAG: hypothetical protein IPM06_02920 [Rhizobiales bacterium]|nr:hypothetical protein [Hyphomicrobiales bacterium]
MKTTLLSSALASAIMLSTPMMIPMGAATPAKAEVSLGVFFGVPHYRHRMGPDYMYRRGYGWYLPRHHARFKMSCGEAKWSVRNRGYRNVSTVECNGATYTFRASRNGHRIVVYVNARSGAVWRG